MADDVSFLKEIDDSLRAERIEQFWARNSLKALLGCAAIVAATAASVLWNDHLHGEQARQTSLILDAQPLLDAGKFDAAAAAYAQGEEGAPGLAAVAALRRAQALLAAGHRDAALAAYRQLAGDSHADRTLSDLAALQASALDPATSPALLAQAAQDGHPYRYTARQMQAANLITAGKNTEARALLTALLADAAQPAGERVRAQELLSLTGGEKP